MQARRLRVKPKNMEFIMRKFFTFGRSKPVNANTTFARARMARSMPGEAGALASIRLGGMSI